MNNIKINFHIVDLKMASSTGDEDIEVDEIMDDEIATLLNEIESTERETEAISDEILNEEKELDVTSDDITKTRNEFKQVLRQVLAEKKQKQKEEQQRLQSIKNAREKAKREHAELSTKLEQIKANGTPTVRI